MSDKYPGDDDDRTIVETVGYENSGWWTGLVRDRAPRTGEIRLRLERVNQTHHSGWKPIQSWRIRPDYWPEEKRAVEQIEQGNGTTDPPKTPIDDSLDVLRYVEVRRDEHRWVAAVRVYNQYRTTEQTRLYHWAVPTRKRRQRWTVGVDWPRLIRHVTQHL